MGSATPQPSATANTDAMSQKNGPVFNGDTRLLVMSDSRHQRVGRAAAGPPDRFR